MSHVKHLTAFSLLLATIPFPVGCSTRDPTEIFGLLASNGPELQQEDLEANVSKGAESTPEAPENDLVGPPKTDLSNPPAESPNAVPNPLESRPFGAWLLESGTMLPTFVAGPATFGQTTDVTALILNENGTGRVFFKDRLTGAHDCVRAFALFNGDTLVLDFAAEPTTDVRFNVALEDYTYFFPVVVADESSLGIADEAGNIALFSRVSVLPPSVTCGELELVDRFDGLPDPQFFGDLVQLNGDLVYNSGARNQIETIDPESGVLGAPLGVNNSRLVQTSQDGFLWTHCGCGGSRDAFKRTLSSVVDTVDSELEMGGAVVMRAMAYDPMTDRLWIHGRPFDTSFGRFFVVNTNGEPDLVEKTLNFNRDLRALAFDGAHLWGIVTVASQSVVRIDPLTGVVVDSFEVPDEDVSWSGLVIVDESMYLLGKDLDGEGVIVRTAVPQ